MLLNALVVESNFFSVLCFFAMPNHTVICRSRTWNHQLAAQYDDE